MGQVLLVDDYSS